MTTSPPFYIRQSQQPYQIKFLLPVRHSARMPTSAISSSAADSKSTLLPHGAVLFLLIQKFSRASLLHSNGTPRKYLPFPAAESGLSLIIQSRSAVPRTFLPKVEALLFITTPRSARRDLPTSFLGGSRTLVRRIRRCAKIMTQTKKPSDEGFCFFVISQCPRCAFRVLRLPLSDRDIPARFLSCGQCRAPKARCFRR